MPKTLQVCIPTYLIDTSVQIYMSVLSCILCRSTMTRGTMITSTSWNETSSIVFSFNPNLQLERIGFAEFNFPAFLADLGGSLGLWLGLGVVQMLELIINISRMITKK